jgi:hypothetical protein
MARVVLAAAFENLRGGYKTDVSPPVGRQPASFRSPRQPIEPPTGLLNGPPGKVPTSTARPKPSNAAIPYARTAPKQIDAGEIVLVHTRSSQNQTRSSCAVGSGTNSLCRVATIEDVNKSLAALPPHAAAAPDDLPGDVACWLPDGVAIGFDEEDDKGLNLCNVCVANGPTPILNDLSPERNLDRRIFDKTCGPPVRLFVGLRATRVVGDTWRFRFVRFSSGQVERGKLPDATANSFLVKAWQIGILVDPSSDIRFVKSGSIVVSIQPPLTRRLRTVRKQFQRYDSEGQRGAHVAEYGPRSLEEILKNGQQGVVKRVLL